MTTHTGQPNIGELLAILAHHHTQHPDLPPWYKINERHNGIGGYQGLELHLWPHDNLTGDQLLQAWADTLDHTTHTWALRYSQHPTTDATGLAGHIDGILHGMRIQIEADIPPDSVPTDAPTNLGRITWTPARENES